MKININFMLAIAVIGACLAPELALAQAADGALPYESGLRTLRTSLEGPVPFVISLVGIVACGAMLIFGGEISGFMRTMVFIVLVVSVIMQAASIVTLLQGGGTSNGQVQNYFGAPTPATA